MTVLLFGIGLLPAAWSSAATGPPPILEPVSCPEGLTGSDVTCGTIGVPESRAGSDGRTIPIYVVRVAAREEPAAEPLFVLRGGPGIAAASRAGGDIERWRTFNIRRDLVFVDSRGTGRSAPLDCQPQGSGTANFFNGSLTLDDVARCRDALSTEHDLAQFTTAATADDLDAVRRALGYDTVALFGASYGSYLAQVLAQRHPDAITRLVLQAPVPLADRGWAMAASPHYQQARQTEKAIMEAIGDCEASPTCGAAYSDLEDKLTDGLSRLAAEPAEAALPAGDASDGQTMQLTKQHALNLIHALLYDTTDTSQLPILVELLANGRYQALAGAFQRVRSGVVSSVHWGLYISILCSELYARIDTNRALVAGQRRFTTVEETHWGLEACRSWPAAKGVDADGPHETIEVPTLILTGELDPVIPVGNVDLVRRLFPIGPTVVFANTAHSPAPGVWQECSVPLIEAFLSGAIEVELDTSCAGRIERPDFYVPS